MKSKVLLVILIMFTSQILAQEYPLVSITDLNTVPDSLLENASSIKDIGTQYSGDTVRVVGTVLFAPMVNWENDRRLTTSSSKYGNYVTFIQDTAGNVWGGLTVIQADSNFQTGFDIIDTGDVVEITGVVSEGRYGNTTTLDILTEPLTEISIVDSKSKMPSPIVVSFDEFFDNGNFIFEAEKYEGMYVEFQNVTTSDRNPTGSTNFAFSDGSGNKIFMYDQSAYFTTRSHKLTGLTEYETPADGTYLKYIRGILHTRDDGWYVVPLYPGDIKYGETAPPTITMVKDAPAKVAPNESAEVIFKIEDNDGTVSEAKVFYQVDGGDFTEIEMTFQDTAYVATIPGVASDSSMVSYYVYSKDNEANESISPSDTSKKYYYWVLNSDPTIYHVQYTPYRQGHSRFQNESITLEGIITADSSDIDEDGGSAQYMQIPGHDKWAGIRMIKVPLKGQVRGDLVRVSGTVIESYYCTTLDVTSLKVIEHVGEIEPLTLTCDQISTGRNDAAEDYEGMLLKYENLKVIAKSADGNSNFGEILVEDASGKTRVELNDGAHSFHNGWDPSFADSTNLIEINEGDTFGSITGVLYYSFNNFKLIPRKNDDFVDHVTNIKDEILVSNKFELSQNYPNPFNPATKISFTIPSGMNNNGEIVKLVVFDVLGREVKTLVNEIKQPGNYEVNFNANNLTSGIYFYTIKAGDFFQTRKMLLIK